MAATFLTPHTIISGPQALTSASEQLCTLGSHALIVTDQMMVKLGNIKKLTNVLEQHNIQYTLFPEINSEPNNHMIEQGVEMFQTHHCDFLIALGGGSPMDSMKAIAMMLDEAKPMASLMGKNIQKKRPNMAAIPTTAGTGSEATMFTIITDVESQVKMLLKGPCLIPDLAIIDPQFSMSAPKSVTSATGIDALCHAIEAYTSRKAQPMSDTFALCAIKRIFDNLVIAYEEPSNEEARSQMALAALEAGIAFNNASVTIVHGMSRPIGALFHIAHGLSNAMLLEECMDFVANAAQDRFADIARYCAISNHESDEIATTAFLAYLSDFLKKLSIPSMSEAGIDKKTYLEAIDKMAHDAMASGSPSNTIKEITKQDIRSLYKKIYR